MAFMSPALQFNVKTAMVDTKKVIDEESYYQQKNTSVSQLTSKLIYMTGMERKSFALTTRLFGQPYFDVKGMEKLEDGENPFALNSAVKTIEEEEFNYPLMINAKRGGEVAETYVADSTPGIAGQPFKLKFKTNALTKWFFVRSPNGTMCYVRDEPRPLGADLWEYELETGSTNAAVFVPLSEVQANVTWINMFPAVARRGSRNIDIARAITPTAFKNQLTTLRLGLTWKDDVVNKKTKLVAFQDRAAQGSADEDAKKSVTWIDQYTYNYEVDCMEYLESAAWYQEYNRNANGTVSLKDKLTGHDIQVGSGALQQILNKMSYTQFSYEMLNEVIGRAYYGVKGTPKTKTLYTGTLGFRKFQEAMLKKSINFLTDFGMVADKFVTGTDRNLMLGGYFDGFYHVDGWIIKVKKVDIFDNGLITNSPIDEESGLPFESGRIVLIDDAMVEGEQNVQLVLNKNYNPYKHAVVRGFQDIPKSIGLLTGKHELDNGLVQEVASDTAEATYMRKYKMGIQLMRGNTSIDFQYAPTIW